MLLSSGTKYKDNVQAYSHTVGKVLEHQVHQLLEGGRLISQTYRTDKVLIQTLWHMKGSFWLIAFAYANLVVSMA